MVESAQDWRRNHPNLFGEAMAVCRELGQFGQRTGNPGSQTGMGTTPVVVTHPFAKDPSEMSLKDGDQPVDGEFSATLRTGVDRTRPELVPRLTLGQPGARCIQSIDTSRVSELAQADPSPTRHAAIGV
jgi:hypothetical protein